MQSILSLYVSVGKYADGAEGVYAEARRAAYRQFVKIVQFIIFIGVYNQLLAWSSCWVSQKANHLPQEWFFYPEIA